MGPVNRFIHESIGLGEATVLGWQTTWRMAGSVTGVLGGLFQGTVSDSNDTVRDAGRAVRQAASSTDHAQ